MRPEHSPIVRMLTIRHSVGFGICGGRASRDLSSIASVTSFPVSLEAGGGSIAEADESIRYVS